MRALTLTQPWATLVAIGAKRIETRSWSTDYRGPLAIHAAKSMPRWAREAAYGDEIGDTLNGAGIYLGGDCRDLPKGAVVATCHLVDVVPTDRVVTPGRRDWDDGWLQWKDGEVTAGWSEYDFGDLAPDRYAWLLADVEPLSEPVSARGRLGLWEWDVPDLAAKRGSAS